MCLRSRCQCRLLGADGTGVSKGGTLGDSHLSLQGVWAKGPNAGIPRGEQKQETGSVRRLHDNKGGEKSIHNSGTNWPSPLLPGLAQGSLLPLLLGLGCFPLSSLLPRIMGFKCLT